MQRAFALMLVGSVAATLAGCTSGGDVPPTSAAPSSSATALPTAVPNTPALRDDVRLTSCAAAPGGWRATGTAGNDRRTEYRYALTIYFTSAKATVLGFARTSVTVAAGKTVTWTARASFAAPAGTKCVLVGVAKG